MCYLSQVANVRIGVARMFSQTLVDMFAADDKERHAKVQEILAALRDDSVGLRSVQLVCAR